MASESELLNKIHAAYGIKNVDLIKKFNPYKKEAIPSNRELIFNIGSDPAMGGPTYVFFTRPNLNLDGESKSAINNRTILNVGSGGFITVSLANLLNNSTNDGLGHFIKLLTNCCESFPTGDVTLDVFNAHSTFDDMKSALPKDIRNSMAAGSISIEFQDKAFNPVLLLIKLWVEYVSEVSNRGTVIPKDDYIKEMRLDYTSTIFVIQTSQDGHIQYMARYVGCFPTAIPYTSRNTDNNEDSITKLSVPFSYMAVDYMNGAIIDNFNAIQPTEVAITNAANQVVKTYLERKGKEGVTNYLRFSAIDTIKQAGG